MWFPAALISSTLITIISIVAVYKIFLDKPQLQIDTKPPQTSVSSPDNTQKPPTLRQLADSGSPSPISSGEKPAAASPTPKPSKEPSVIVLESNITSNPSSSPFTTTISGTINFSGVAPSGSSIVIVARVNGTSDPYQTVVSGISAQSNASWKWAGAIGGKSYDMIAILKGQSGGNNIDYASSQTYVALAPATNQIFTVNVGSSLSAPTGAITTDCYYKNTNNTWYTKVNFTNVSGAQAYWMQVGTTSGAKDLAEVKQDTQSATYQTVNLTLNDSQIYYARYAVASVPNPNSSQYSSFSAVSNIKCP